MWCVQVRDGAPVRCAGPSEIVDAVLHGWERLRCDAEALAWLDAHNDELRIVPTARVELIERRHATDG